MIESENNPSVPENPARRTLYKWCMVPMCTNSTYQTPNKLFISVPRNPIKRKLWMKAMQFKRSVSLKSPIYCCEDHFQLEEDMENYVRFKLMGGQIRVRMKETIVPHIFDCQEVRGAAESGPVSRRKPGKARSNRKSRKLMSTTGSEMDCGDWTNMEEPYFDVGNFLEMDVNEDEDWSPPQSCTSPQRFKVKMEEPTWDLLAREGSLPASDVEEEVETPGEEQQAVFKEEHQVSGAGDKLPSVPLEGDEPPPPMLKVKVFARDTEGRAFGASEDRVYKTEPPDIDDVGPECLGETLVYETENPDFNGTLVKRSGKTSFVYEPENPDFNGIGEKRSEDTSFVYETENPDFNGTGVKHSEYRPTSLVYETENPEFKTEYPDFNDTGVQQSENTSFVIKTENPDFNVMGAEQHSEGTLPFVYETETPDLNGTEVERPEEMVFVYETQTPDVNGTEVERPEEMAFVYETQTSDFHVTGAKNSEEASLVYETENPHFYIMGANDTDQSKETLYVYDGPTGDPVLSDTGVEQTQETLLIVYDDTENPVYSVMGVEQSEAATFVYETRDTVSDGTGVAQSENPSFVYVTDNPGFNATGASQSEEATFLYVTENPGFNGSGVAQSENASFLYVEENPGFNASGVAQSENASFVYETQDPGFSVTGASRSEEASFVRETRAADFPVTRAQRSDATSGTFDSNYQLAAVADENARRGDDVYPVALWKFVPRSEATSESPAAVVISLDDGDGTDRGCETISSDRGGAPGIHNVGASLGQRHIRKQKLSLRPEYDQSTVIPVCKNQRGNYYHQVYTDTEDSDTGLVADPRPPSRKATRKKRRRAGNVGYRQNQLRRTDSEGSGSSSKDERLPLPTDREERMRRREAARMAGELSEKSRESSNLAESDGSSRRSSTNRKANLKVYRNRRAKKAKCSGSRREDTDARGEEASEDTAMKPSFDESPSESEDARPPDNSSPIYLESVDARRPENLSPIYLDSSEDETGSMEWRSETSIERSTVGNVEDSKNDEDLTTRPKGTCNTCGRKLRRKQCLHIV